MINRQKLIYFAVIYTSATIYVQLNAHISLRLMIYSSDFFRRGSRRLDLGLPSEGRHTSGNVTVVPLLNVLQQASRLLAVRRDPQRVRHTSPIPHLAHSLSNTVSVDLAYPDASIQLVTISPLFEVHRTWNGGAIVGNVSFECAVEEKVIVLAPPNPRSAVM